MLEVTESSVMRNPELTIAKLERIVGTGVRLSLDDFGEGYSSLSHIRRLPIHGLKIARPFVKELGDPEGDPMSGAPGSIASALSSVSTRTRNTAPLSAVDLESSDYLERRLGGWCAQED